MENKGQLADENGKMLNDVRYYGRQNGTSVYFRLSGVAFVFTRQHVYARKANDKRSQLLKKIAKGRFQNLMDSVTTDAAGMGMQFVNPNPQVSMESEGSTGYYENFFLAQCPAGIRASGFQKLVYKNLWPHIDMAFVIAHDSAIEYSFIVHPGGDVKDIRLRWAGMDSMQVLDGGIRFTTSLGYIKQNNPNAFVASGEMHLNSKYVVDGNETSFETESYDPGLTLTIDPTLEWATYYGGNASDEAEGVATDHAGNIFVCGYTQSTSGIASSGAFQTKFGGTLGGGIAVNGDAFLAKYTSSGKKAWSTYYGGANDETAYGVATDTGGNIYISGFSNSTSGIATSGAFLTSHNSYTSAYDAFLVKFNTSGARLWGTYYGGQNDEITLSLSADDSGQVYMGGVTSSPSGVATSGAYQTSYIGGAWDNFIAKFSGSGQRLWGTYFGDTMGGGYVSYSKQGYVYLGGETGASTGIATAGAFQSAIASSYTTFISQFSCSGQLNWATYFGGSGQTYCGGLTSDIGGNVFIGGYTQSTSGIATSGAFQSAPPSSYVFGFLTKFNASGHQVWGTYYNDKYGDTQIQGLATDGPGNVYVTGIDFDGDTVVPTKNAYQYKFSGAFDAFLGKFSKTGKRVYGSYFGGQDSVVYGNAVATDTSGGVVIAGKTNCHKGLATSGAAQSYKNGYMDAYVAKFIFPFLDAGIGKILLPLTSTCPGSKSITVRLNNYGKVEIDSVNIGWSLNGKSQKSYLWKGKLKPDSNATVNIATITLSPGIDSIKAWTSEPNGEIDSVPQDDSAMSIDTINMLPVPHAGGNHVVCNGSKVSLGSPSVSGHSYEWVSSPSGFSSALSDPVDSPTRPTTYYLIETITATGCLAIDSAKVSFLPSPTPNVGGNKTICPGTVLILGDSAISGHVYKWSSRPTGLSTTAANPSVKPLVATTYYLTETISSDGCTKADSAHISLYPKPKADAGGNSGICQGDMWLLGASAISGYTYSWKSIPTGYSSPKNSPSVSPKTTTTYYLTVTNTVNGCKDSDSAVIVVHPLPAAKNIGNSAVCLGNSIHIGAAADTNVTYSWTSNPSGFTSDSANPLVTPKLKTIYTLTETNNATLCARTDSFSISINPLPIVYAGGNHTVCNGGAVTIGEAPVAGHAYSWRSRPAGFMAATDTVTVKPDSQTVYYLTDTIKATGCYNTDSAVVNIAAPFQANAGVNDTVCQGNAAIIGSTAINGYTYSWSSNPPGFTSSKAQPLATPVRNTVYYLTQTNAIGCTAVDSVVVALAPAAAPNINPGQTVCAGTQVKPGGIKLPGYFYSWTSSPAGFTSNQANPVITVDTTTLFYLTAINPSGCGKKDTVRINVNPLPITPGSPQYTVCQGSPLSFGISARKGYTYSWTSRPAGYHSTTSSPLIIPKASAVYYVSETITATGCSANDSVTVVVNPLPKPDAGAAQSVCSGSIAHLGALKGSSNDSYQWTSDPSGFQSTDAQTVDSPKTNTWYYLSETDNITGCSNTDSADITVFPLPDAPINGFTKYCIDSSAETFDVTNPTGDQMVTNWNWQVAGGKLMVGQGSRAIMVRLDKGLDTITLIETSVKGCTSKVFKYLNVDKVPDAHFTIADDSSSYFFKATDTAQAMYNWLLGDGAKGSGDTLSHKYSFTRDSFLHIVLKITDANGCSNVIDSIVEIRFVPPPQFGIWVYPNPFVNTAYLKIDLEKPAQVQIATYDAIGRLVSTGEPVNQPAGEHIYTFDTYKTAISQGIYFLRIMIDGKVYVKPLVKAR